MKLVRIGKKTYNANLFKSYWWDEGSKRLNLQIDNDHYIFNDIWIGGILRNLEEYLSDPNDNRGFTFRVDLEHSRAFNLVTGLEL